MNVAGSLKDIMGILSDPGRAILSAESQFKKKLSITHYQHVGSSGEDVRKVQRAFNVHAKMLKPLTPDGRFGNETHKAIVAYQQLHGLKWDGIVGPLTANALGLLWYGPSPKSVVHKPQSVASSDRDTQEVWPAVAKTLLFIQAAYIAQINASNLQPQQKAMAIGAVTANIMRMMAAIHAMMAGPQVVGLITGMFATPQTARMAFSQLSASGSVAGGMTGVTGAQVNLLSDHVTSFMSGKVAPAVFMMSVGAVGSTLYNIISAVRSD
jgi:hypothetical protein